MTEYDPNQFTTCPGCSVLREKRVMEDGLCPWCRLEKVDVSPNPFIPLVNRAPSQEHGAVCPEFKVPCQRGCVVLCHAAIPQEYGKDWWAIPYAEGTQVGAYQFNNAAAQLAVTAYPAGWPSSEPPCICPEGAVDGRCSRHGYMYGSPYTIDKDHLAEWDFEHTWPKAMSMFAICGMPAELHVKMALDYIRSMLEMRRMAAQTALPPQSFAYEAVFHGQLDDVLLAYKRFEGPRPYMDPNWVPPKRTWRIRFRVWRHNANHAVQQWIHDHLTEAYL